MDQNAMRNGMLAVINDRGIKKKAVADAMGISADTLKRSLRGDRPIVFHEFTAFVAFVGLTPKEVLRFGGWREEATLK